MYESVGEETQREKDIKHCTMFVKCKRERVREKDVIDVIVRFCIRNVGFFDVIFIEREREIDVIDVIVRFLIRNVGFFIRNVGFFIRNVGFLIRNVGFLDFLLETSDFVTRHTSFRHTSHFIRQNICVRYLNSVHSEST